MLRLQEVLACLFLNSVHKARVAAHRQAGLVREHGTCGVGDLGIVEVYGQRGHNHIVQETSSTNFFASRSLLLLFSSLVLSLFLHVAFSP